MMQFFSPRPIEETASVAQSTLSTAGRALRSACVRRDELTFQRDQILAELDELNTVINGLAPAVYALEDKTYEGYIDKALTILENENVDP